jgi:hypothetical protein
VGTFDQALALSLAGLPETLFELEGRTVSVAALEELVALAAEVAVGTSFGRKHLHYSLGSVLPFAEPAL